MLQGEDSKLSRVGMVARWRPVHLGHEAVLSGLLRSAHQVVLGIGSSNKYDHHNPFTSDETREQLLRAMAGIRCRTSEQLAEVVVLDVPDLGDPPRWKDMVRDLFGPLSRFYSANEWVAGLLRVHYSVEHPLVLLRPEERVRVSGTMVRQAMARGDAWKELVPHSTRSFLEERDLVARFRREFGLRTIGETPPF